MVRANLVIANIVVHIDRSMREHSCKQGQAEGQGIELAELRPCPHRSDKDWQCRGREKCRAGSEK